MFTTVYCLQSTCLQSAFLGTPVMCSTPSRTPAIAPGMIFGDAISIRYNILHYVSNVDLLASSWYLVMRH